MKPIILTPLEERTLKVFLDLEPDHVAITQLSPDDEKLLIKSLRSLEKKGFCSYFAPDCEVELLEPGAQWLTAWGLANGYTTIERPAHHYAAKSGTPYVCLIHWED